MRKSNLLYRAYFGINIADIRLDDTSKYFFLSGTISIKSSYIPWTTLDIF